jgi:hypothetical protein
LSILPGIQILPFSLHNLINYLQVRECNEPA